MLHYFIIFFVRHQKKTEKRLTEELARQKSLIKQAESDVEKLRIKFQEKVNNQISKAIITG
jgi:hypothetical protein